VQTLRVLQQQFDVAISDDQITDGLLHTVANTGLLGRWQQLGTRPKIICDTAHNKDGLFVVMQQLERQVFEKLHFVLAWSAIRICRKFYHFCPKTLFIIFANPICPVGSMPICSVKSQRIWPVRKRIQFCKNRL
jgi:dihydrofolate synthase/folylpolyglutamate synthase